jgi:curli biogenesis system outer membrane secretion channel CsgG
MRFAAKYLRKVFLFIAVFCIAAGISAASETDEMLNDALSKIKPTLTSIPANIKRIAVNAIKPDPKGVINNIALQDQIITAILATERFQVIDRESLNTLLQEQKLQLSGLVGSSELVEVGKLIGVQGFFFGSVDQKDDKVILNLKLVDVESSAIVYSKTLVGEALSFSKWGLNIITVSRKIGATLTDTQTGNTKSVDSSLSGFGAGLSYKQGFQSTKLFQFGFDVNYLSLSGDGKVEFLGNTYGIICDYTGSSEIDLKAKLYLSGKAIFKTKTELVNPYIGGQYAMYSITKNIVANSQGPGNQTMDGKDQTTVPFNAITPVIGVDFNFSKKLTFFVEGAMFPAAEESPVRAAYVANTVSESKITAPSQTVVNLGVRYFFK